MLHLTRVYRVTSLNLVLLGSVFSLAVGCSAPQKRICQDTPADQGDCVAVAKPQVERGRPAPVLDTVGWVVGIPSKILMLDHRVNNHNVSAQTEVTMEEYLARNGLDDVKVRINEYDPADEWRRLAQNDSMAWPVRYSLGTLSVVGYTLLPGRVFGGDRYNPFTNTISLYSDVSAVALYEGGRARDYAGRDHKALYAVAGVVPGVNIVHEVQASDYAINYLHLYGTPEELKDGYRSVYPAFAINASESLSSFTALPIVLPAAVVGHVAGQVTASRVEKSEPQPVPRPTTPVPTVNASLRTSQGDQPILVARELGQ